MKKIRIKEPGFEFEESCIRIQRVFAKNDLDITIEQAKTLWGMHSEDYCAGWLDLPADDKYIIECLQKYYVVEK